jgi:prepilin-type N-terminal cleavage/methylation domain-containing protein
MEGIAVTSRKLEGVVRSRSGFTLVEALVCVVVLSLIALIGLPKISAAMMRSNLRSARTTVINLVATARAASVQTGRRTWLKFDGNNALVLARPRRTAPINAANNADTIGTVQDLSAQYKVTVGGVDSIQFDPRGFGASFGDTTSVTLSRSSHSETVRLDGLGRVIK